MRKLFILSLLFFSFAQAETFQCKVVEVLDGNAILCLFDQRKMVKIKLYQIYSSEGSQAYSLNAKQALSDMIFNKVVWLENKRTDRYKRMLRSVSWQECSPIST